VKKELRSAQALLFHYVLQIADSGRCANSASTTVENYVVNVVHLQSAETEDLRRCVRRGQPLARTSHNPISDLHSVLSSLTFHSLSVFEVKMCNKILDSYTIHNVYYVNCRIGCRCCKNV
jgi:hypothetical protein